jgi:hypothetical protein
VTRRWVLFLSTLLILVFAAAPKAEAQTARLAGRYQCVEMRWNGKTMPCKLTPLDLKTDGSFELRGREGRYMVTGEWLVLSDEVKRTKAKLAPGYRIVFRYRYRSAACVVTFQRKFAELGKTALS